MTRWERQREAWARWAGDYDARTAGVERRFLGPTRPWVCGRAVGDVVEVAVGTGANLPHYPAGVRLTAVDLDEAMLAKARTRASELGLAVDLGVADAMALPFDDASFDTVVCTYALCGVPDVRGALAEFLRVLRPGGKLLLADHVSSSSAVVRLLQRGLEAVTAPRMGEYWTRRPLLVLADMGVPAVETHRRHIGVIECVEAQA